MKTEWICSKCGRRVPLQKDSNEFCPSAGCRIPEAFFKEQSSIYKQYHKKFDGVGTCLINLLEKLGIYYDQLSKFKLKTDLMNNNGIEWCQNNKITILEWLKEEADNRNIHYLPKLASAILRLAIKKSIYSKSLI